MEKTFEIRNKKGTDDYSTILYPATKLNNVIFKKDGINTIYAEEELISMYKMINQTKLISTSVYVCTENNQSIIPINNDNYNFLDSGIEVYYNGLLLINKMHYIIYNQSYIKLLDFSCSLNDEITFKILNSNKVLLEIDYENISDEKGNEIKDIIDSINSYINLVNSGKKMISDEFKSANIDVEWNDTFEKIAIEISKILGTRKNTPNDFGSLFAMPYYDVNISFIYGFLFGNKVDNNLLPNNLGTLFNY